MLNLTNVHYKIGDIFSDWRKELVSEDQKVGIQNSKNSLEIILRKSDHFSDNNIANGMCQIQVSLFCVFMFGNILMTTNLREPSEMSKILFPFFKVSQRNMSFSPLPQPPFPNISQLVLKNGQDDLKEKGIARFELQRLT